ncbi:MAG: hypothetical protein IT375_15745 [Polyangiaceae bacterium]|nr:hypothetical protein [Polyangiaceae bacterium]
MDRVIKFLLSLIATSAPLTTLAEPPRVHFDTPYAVACRDVTPENYAALHPGKKLVEVRLEISSLLVAGSEKDLRQYLIRVQSPERSLAIADYLPKTAHEAIASSLSMEQSTERNASIGINVSGKYELFTLPGPSASVGERKTSSVKCELLPPLETVAASGTLERGTALFFKIKSTPRNLLEGTREYGLVLSVPAVWRADYLHVRCQAEGIKRGVVSTFDEPFQCGQRDFVVSLYQVGDEPARAIAENFARREAAKAADLARSKNHNAIGWASR